MTFDEAMNYIEEKNKLGIVPGLESVTELLRRLGNPQNTLRCLHIAGTNGKGSVFAFVERALLAAGFHVGRYISPTMFTYLERFSLDGESMSEGAFARILSVVRAEVSAMEAEGFLSPTAFEIETAVGFVYFAEQKADYVLLECGMGGRLDGTNVLAHPLACVMAQISMDHMQYLGDTLEAIAAEKAGIIKAGAICVSAPQKHEVRSVLEETCRRLNVPYTEVNPEAITVIRMDISGSRFSYGGEEYDISLLGEHQIGNAATAVELLRGLSVEEPFIRRGLAEARWPGRLTKIGENPYVFVDGAHNEAAWEYLGKAVKKYFTNRRIIYIIGVLKDKEYHKMLSLLTPTMSCAVAITPNNARGLAKEVLAKLISERGVPAVTAETAESAMELARKQAGAEDVILVCGSLSFLADYLLMETGL